jgi:ribosomal protein S18 acetylase RimI-like enzyme
MSFEILTYNESFLGEAVSVFNRQTEAAELVVRLTPEIFAEQIVSKSCFSSEGCFVAAEGGRAIGLALTALVGDAEGAQGGCGAIDGLFFPADRLTVGEALVARCVEHLRARGAATIYGFASGGGYPFWRGLYCGAEPVCLTNHSHAWIAFMSRGFRHHQQSVNYMGPAARLGFRGDLDYEEKPLDISSSWARDSWKGHKPMRISAVRDGRAIGHIGWVDMPYMSAHLGRRMAGIYSLSVVPEARRQQVASSLLGKLFERAGQIGVERILVGTTVDNTAARRTYERAGMAVVAFRTGTVLVPE